jgi:hemolysin III
MKRTKLADREMPGYSRGEETIHMVTHIVGAALGVVALVSCLVLADTAVEVVTSLVYTLTMILLYTASSIYHGLRHSTAKKVFQVLDHCTIYLFIAGTYTIFVLCSLRYENAALAWVLFAIEWTLAAVAVTLTAIDIKKYQYFSFVCYIVMGWSVLIAIPPTVRALGWAGATLLLAGGIAYTIGSILYVIGKKKRYAHAVFHFFILLGTLLQFLCVVIFVL